MVKRIFGYIFVLLLFAGSICGIVFGAKYNNEKQNQSVDVSEYIQENSELKTTINSLTAEKTALESELTAITAQNEENIALANSLSANVTQLQQSISELQSVNNANILTINQLNAQIVNLNSTITTLNVTIAQNSNTISQLNAQIANLEKSISYYEQLLSAYQDDTKVIATFEFDNSVYNVQVLNIGSCASVANPANTEYIEFLGWTVGGVTVEPSTYALNEDTTFIAKVKYSYDVTFISETTVVDSQIVAENGLSTLPASPTKEGYTFVGWTLDGDTVVNPLTSPITAKTTYIAKFIKLYNVVFMSEESIYNSQQVEAGNSMTIPANPTKENYDFVGWSIDGENVVDLTTYILNSDVTFEAIFEPSYSWQKINSSAISITRVNAKLVTTSLSSYMEDINSALAVKISGTVTVKVTAADSAVEIAFEYDGETSTFEYEGINYQLSLSESGTFAVTFGSTCASMKLVVNDVSIYTNAL